MPLDEEGYSEDCEYVTATIHKEDEWDDDNIPTEYMDGTYRV